MENTEIIKAVYRLFREIAEREKKRAINSGDYALALIATILQGIFREAELSCGP